MTVSAWVKGWPERGWNPFISKNGEENGWQMRRHGGDNTLDFTTRGFGANNGDFASNTQVVANGQWHLVTMTYDSNPATGSRFKRIYVDGVFDREETAAAGSISASHAVAGLRGAEPYGRSETGRASSPASWTRSRSSTGHWTPRILRHSPVPVPIPPCRKTGSGTLTISGDNTYDGPIQVDEGTSSAAASTALGPAGGEPTTVADGGTLALAGGITLAEDVTDRRHRRPRHGRRVVERQRQQHVSRVRSHPRRCVDGHLSSAPRAAKLTVATDINYRRGRASRSTVRGGGGHGQNFRCRRAGDVQRASSITASTVTRAIRP